MKKTLFASVLLFAWCFGLAGSIQAASAATSVTWPIGIIAAAYDIDLQGAVYPMHFGLVPLAGNTFSNQAQGLPRCTIANWGFATVDYTVSATVTCGSGPAWALGPALGAAGYDTCIVAAIFTKPLDTASDSVGGYSRDLVASDFGNNDVLGPVPIMAGPEVLARDNSNPDPDDGEEVKGYHVQPVPGLTERSLRFLVQTPAAISGNAEQIINIVIGAQVH